MEAYKLEFNFFSGVEWKNKTVEVIALNKEEIKNVFFEELKFATEREEPEEKWKRYENKIEHIILNFPLVNSYTW